MISAKNFFMRCVNAKIGGGGFKCRCCMSPNRKLRKAELRAARRRFGRLIKKIENE